MKLEYQNFYAFEFTLGLIGVISGIYLLQQNHWFLILIIGSFILIYNGITRWNKSQTNKDKITQLELEGQDAKLDFDIQTIYGENDIDFEPEGFDIQGQPEGVNTYNIVEIKTIIQVYNPCLIDNIVRSVEVSINRKSTHKIMEIINFSPVKIKPRDHEIITFSSWCRDFQGKKNDKIIITIKTMDKKKVKKEKMINYYAIGSNRKEYEIPY